MSKDTIYSALMLFMALPMLFISIDLMVAGFRGRRSMTCPWDAREVNLIFGVFTFGIVILCIKAAYLGMGACLPLA